MGLYPHQLSGGQQQRVAIARALALKPDILCFDEPTSALDPELTGEVLRVIRSLAEQKMTMIIVTHEMAFARDVADRVIFMDDGVIVEQGQSHQVIEHPTQERTRQFCPGMQKTDAYYTYLFFVQLCRLFCEAAYFMHIFMFYQDYTNHHECSPEVCANFHAIGTLIFMQSQRIIMTSKTTTIFMEEENMKS